MSISRQTLTIVIVTFKSEKVIDNCIKSIPDQIKIIIVDNSNDQNFKDTLEKKYENVECILSTSNLGMGSGNNLGLNNVKTDYALILNPDVILQVNTISEISNESKKIESFAVLAPLSEDEKYPNYKIKHENKKLSNPYQNQGSSSQFKKTIKSGSNGFPYTPLSPISLIKCIPII